MAARECDKFGSDLSAYLDGELSDVRVAQIERHTIDCEACRARLAELREVSDQLAALPRLRAPDQLTAAMRRQAERRMLLGGPEASRRSRLLMSILRVGASAALIAACMFIGWQAFQPAQVKREMSSPLAENGGAPEEKRGIERGRYSARDTKAEDEEDLAEAPAVALRFQRSTPSEHAETGVRGRETDLSRLRSLGYAGGDKSGRAGLEPKTPASTEPVVAAKPVPVQTPVGVAKMRSEVEVANAATTMPPAGRLAGEMCERYDALASEGNPAAVDVVVTPQTYRAYVDAARVVAEWQTVAATKIRESALADKPAMRLVVPEGAQPVPPERCELVVRVEPAQAQELIQQLELNAPRQVSVAANLEQMRQIMPAPQAGGRGGGRRAWGAEVGEPPDSGPGSGDERKAAAREPSAEVRERLGRSPVTRGNDVLEAGRRRQIAIVERDDAAPTAAETVAQSRAHRELAGDGVVDVGNPANAAPADTMRTGAGAEQHGKMAAQPATEALGYVGREAERPAATRPASAGQAITRGAGRGAPVRLDDFARRARRFFELADAARSRGQVDNALAGPGTLTLRVILLPPPQAPPASQPAGRAAD